MPDVSKSKLPALSWHVIIHFRSAVKIQTFSPVFPLAGSITKAFFRLFLWNFKEKTSTISMAQPFLFSVFPEAEALGNARRFKARTIGSGMAYSCFIFAIY